MMMKRVCLVVLCLAMGACDGSVANGGKKNADAWIGRWQGVEGTFLDIAKTDKGYNITIQDLDGPRAFEGKASAEGLSFTRDNVQETIHAGDGAATGMKWLTDKHDCLIVKTGEGYCRH